MKRSTVRPLLKGQQDQSDSATRGGTHSQRESRSHDGRALLQSLRIQGRIQGSVNPASTAIWERVETNQFFRSDRPSSVDAALHRHCIVVDVVDVVECGPIHQHHMTDA